MTKEILKNKAKTSQKGITLIALIITIIVLLILAGVTISTIVNNNSSSMEKAKEAREKTEMAEAKERVVLMITEWKTMNLENGTPSLASFLTGNDYRTKREGFNVTDVDGPDNNEYVVTVMVGNTPYYVTINAENSNNPVISNVSKTTGKITANIEVSGGYKSAGDSEGVEISISATAPAEDLITAITSTQNLTQKSTTVTGNTQTAGAVFKATANGTYNFTITSLGGITKVVSVNVNNFIVAPVIPAEAVTSYENSITINKQIIASQYAPEEGVTLKYYFGTSSDACDSEITGDTITGLTQETAYYLKVKAKLGTVEVDSEVKEVRTRYSYTAINPADYGKDALYIYNQGDACESVTGGWNTPRCSVGNGIPYYGTEPYLRLYVATARRGFYI